MQNAQSLPWASRHNGWWVGGWGSRRQCQLWWPKSQFYALPPLCGSTRRSSCNILYLSALCERYGDKTYLFMINGDSGFTLGEMIYRTYLSALFWVLALKDTLSLEFYLACLLRSAHQDQL